MDRDTLRFIDRIYRDLYKSPEVLKHSSGNETEKFKNLEEYLNTLESVHERAAQSEERIKTIKRMYYNKYVIKKDNIPDSYYENQKRMALERGFGHIEIDEWLRNKLQDEVIENQRTSLDTWLDYLLSEDAKFYPFWAKYWAFQGMLKMGIYDKKTGKFSKRTNETVAPFVDLNREALAKSIDLVIKMVGKEKIDDRDLEIIVKSGSFPKIYTHILKNILSDNKKIIKRNQGKWVKYNQKSDHMPLVNSLQGYNTGWCTAGEDTAKTQLAHGDFYVYYTLDENDEYKVPRIAIRMENDKIGEVRGVGENQNIEPEMEKVVEEKLKDFPDRDEYYKKVNDMKKLTEIYNKFKENIELTDEELRFLYEIDNDIDSFGYEKDPRIAEIINERDKKNDLAIIFNCSPDKVAFKISEIKDDTVCFWGDICFKKCERLDQITKNETFKIPENVIGNLYLNSLISSKGITFPKYLKGDLRLDCLIDSHVDLILPEIVKGDLNLGALSTARKISFPKYVYGDLYLKYFSKTSGYEMPEEVWGSLTMNCIRELTDFKFPRIVDGDLEVARLDIATRVEFPENIGSELYLPNLELVEDVKFPKEIGTNLTLRCLEKADNTILPAKVGWNVYLDNLKGSINLVLPEYIGNSLDMNRLKSATGITFPKNIEKELNMNALESLEDFVFPEVGEKIELASLKTTINVTFPEKLKKMQLFHLETAENTVFPKRIEESFAAPLLKTAKHVKFPKHVVESFEANSLINTEDVEFPNSVGNSFSLKSIKELDKLRLDKGADTIYINLKNLEKANILMFPALVGDSIDLFSLDSWNILKLPNDIFGNLYIKDRNFVKKARMPEYIGGQIYYDTILPGTKNRETLEEAKGKKIKIS